MNIFPELIRVNIINKNSMDPIMNIAVSIKLFANHKNDYNFVLPLTDANGCIEIRKDWLEAEIKKDMALFVMDYFSTLEDCKLQIEISVLSDDALKRTIKAMYLFKDVTGISDEDISKYISADNHKYFPCVENIKLDSRSIFDIDIFLNQNYE